MKDFKLEDDHMASFIPVLNFIPVLRPAWKSTDYLMKVSTHAIKLLFGNLNRKG